MSPADIKAEYRQLLSAQEAAERKLIGFCRVIAPDFCQRKVGDDIAGRDGKLVRIERITLGHGYRGGARWEYRCRNILASGFSGRTVYTVLEEFE